MVFVHCRSLLYCLIELRVEVVFIHHQLHDALIDMATIAG